MREAGAVRLCHTGLGRGQGQVTAIQKKGAAVSLHAAAP
jgi:hypothetical protein